MGISNFNDRNGEGYVPLAGSDGTTIYYESGGERRFYRRVRGVYRRLSALDLGSDSEGNRIISTRGRICIIDIG